jgi:hypothetical protein
MDNIKIMCSHKTNRARHPKKEVETVLRKLEAMDWTIEPGRGGHAWGLLRRPFNDETCRCGEYCQMSISSTPQNPGNHASKLLAKAQACQFVKKGR